MYNNTKLILLTFYYIKKLKLEQESFVEEIFVGENQNHTSHTYIVV